MAGDLESDIELLSHTRSAKRRAAAKRLRSRGDPSAGPALLAALEKELQDSRTWETQYQMIMAIGHCGYTEALPFLESLASRQIGGMIDLAIGDAMLRLSKRHSDDADVILSLIGSGQPLLAEGAIQAMAMLRMVPDESTMRRLVDYGVSLELGDRDWTVVFLLRAVPGWPEDIVSPLIERWASVEFRENQEVHRAVGLARERKYSKWSPL
jgi:hypothetical protein